MFLKLEVNIFVTYLNIMSVVIDFKDEKFIR